MQSNLCEEILQVEKENRPGRISDSSRSTL
jgi:hypothetical protein